MSTLESIPQTLGVDAPWMELGGAYWLDYPDIKVPKWPRR